MDWLTGLMAVPVVKAAVYGAFGGVAADFFAFLKWQSWTEFKTFSPATASLRFVQGALGAVAAYYGWKGATTVVALIF